MENFFSCYLLLFWFLFSRHRPKCEVYSSIDYQSLRTKRAVPLELSVPLNKRWKVLRRSWRRKAILANEIAGKPCPWVWSKLEMQYDQIRNFLSNHSEVNIIIIFFHFLHFILLNVFVFALCRFRAFEYGKCFVQYSLQPFEYFRLSKSEIFLRPVPEVGRYLWTNE